MSELIQEQDLAGENNMALYEIKEEKERVILVGVSTRENDDTEDSLDELKDLVKAAGAEAVGRVIQKKRACPSGNLCRKRQD